MLSKRLQFFLLNVHKTTSFFLQAHFFNRKLLKAYVMHPPNGALQVSKVLLTPGYSLFALFTSDHLGGLSILAWVLIIKAASDTTYVLA